MKTQKWKLFLFVPMFLLACNTQVDEPDALHLEVSKEKNIKQLEPVFFKLLNSQGNDINWDINPAEGVELKQKGDVASARFTKAGNYTITSKLGDTQLSRILQVTDSVYIPPFSDSYIVPINTTDKLKVDYVINDSSEVGKPDILLILLFSTTEKYPSSMNYLMATSDDDQKIEIRGVYVPELKFQTDETSIADGGIVLFPAPNSRSNPISITLNGTEYTGSYFVAEKKLHLDWKHADIIEFVNTVPINQD